MGLNDPFSTTYQGSFQAGQSLGQGLQSAAGDYAKVAERKKAYDMLKASGQITEYTTPPSDDELKKGLESFAKQHGISQVSWMESDDPKENRASLEQAYTHLGAPMPEGVKGIKYNLATGTKYTPNDNVSMEGVKKDKSLPEQISEYAAAQKMLEAAGVKDAQVSVGSKSDTIRPASQATANKEEAKSNAESYAQDVVDGKQTYDPKVYNYRDRGAYTEALRKKGIDVGQADLNYYSMQREASALNGPTQTRLRQAISSTKETLPLLSKATEDLKASGINFTNMIDLKAKLNGLSPDQKNKAVAYMTQLTTLQDELGVTLQSGGVPTDMAKQMAKDIFNPFYSADKMETAIQQVGLNMDIRQDVISNTSPILLNSGSGKGVANVSGMQPKQSQQVDYKSKYGLN